MQTALFCSWYELVTGLVAGIAFGFLLQKGSLTRFTVIVNQLLLKDFTVLKVMMTALTTSSIGYLIYSTLYTAPEASISATTAYAALVGGGIFGVGMAILGYCPGTAVGALADGSKDMKVGILGMCVGAALYAECFDWIQATIKPAEDLMQVTLPEYFGIEPWVVVLPFLAIAAWYLITKKLSLFVKQH
ncbi:MAG: YeeE/YedE family protein [Verrucomicrobia bacterium]|nr:YeeE/YedE family protein [Verrucomicrobiota bacterium]